MKGLPKALLRQLERNKDKNILHDQIEHSMELDPLFLACLEDMAESVAPQRDQRIQKEMVSFAAISLIERLYAVNQYIQVNPDQARALEETYASTWERITETRDIPKVLKSFHYPKLRTWVAQLYPESLRTALRSIAGLGHVANEEYSVELQLKLLRLDLTQVKQPVLDIGCGKHGYLVHYLRSHKVETHGIDRVIKVQGKYLKQADWLTYRLIPSSWGTVISNLAFSNHFAFIERYEPEKVGLYSEKYKEILASLMPGGSFIYAPQSLSLEEQADRGTYKIEQWDIHRPYKGVRITKSAL